MVDAFGTHAKVKTRDHWTPDDAAWGTPSEVTPKFIATSDPAAQWTGAHKGHAFFAYSTNYLIDLKASIVMDVEPTRAIRQAEEGATKTMIEHTEERFGLKGSRCCSPRRIAWLRLAAERGKCHLSGCRIR